MRPASRMLLACLRPGAGADAAGAAAAWPASGEDWERVAREAERHGVVPLLHAALRARAAEPAMPPPPASVTAALARGHASSALRARWVQADLGRVLGVLRDCGVPVVALKGAVLATAVYGDAALRPMGDIDLLVPPERLRDAEAALRRVGYEGKQSWDRAFDYGAHRHARPLVHPAGVPVELHRRLSAHPGLARDEGVWARAGDVVIAGAPALAPSADDLLVHLCVHVAYDHRFETRLLHLYDLVVVVERLGDRLDWRRVAAIAAGAGVGRYVYCALRVADELLGLGADAPVESIPHERRDAEVVGVLREFVLDDEPDVSGVPEAYRRLHRADTLGAKARVLARALVPRAGEVRAVYGLPAGGAVGVARYVAHAWSRLRRRGPAMLALVRGAEQAREVQSRERGRAAIGRWIDADRPRPGAAP